MSSFQEARASVADKYGPATGNVLSQVKGDFKRGLLLIGSLFSPGKGPQKSVGDIRKKWSQLGDKPLGTIQKG